MGVSTIILAAGSLYSAIQGQDSARRDNKARADAKKEKKAREAALAAEAAAAEAAKKKAETSGQRVGFGGAGAPTSRSVFVGGGNTGFVAPGPSSTGEDTNIGRSTLFGN